MRLRTFMITASAAALGFAGAASAGNNDLFVEQVGVNNFVNANQAGNNNQTYAVQHGNYNTGNAATDVASGNTSNNQALLKQTASRNIGSWSALTGASQFSGNTIGIVQETSRNYAKLKYQNGSAINSEIFIQQSGGFGNYVGSGAAVSSQSGNSAQNGATLAFNKDGVDTTKIQGSSVYSVSSQTTAPGLVHGTGNSVGVVQNGVNNDLALSVDGNFNKVGGDGDFAATELSAHASGTFFGSGDEIDPGANQFGVDGLASQDGNDNTGVIAIAGNNNAVGFSQAGNNNVNEVYVSGHGNLAGAIQN